MSASPRGLASGLAADPVQPQRAAARHRRHRRRRPSAGAALPRRGRDRRARLQRPLLRVRLPAHGHDRPDRAGFRPHRRRRAARRPRPRDAARDPDRRRIAGCRTRHRVGRARDLRPQPEGRGRARDLPRDPPARRAGGAGEYGPARLAARHAERARPDGAADRDQRRQHRARSLVRAGLRLGRGGVAAATVCAEYGGLALGLWLVRRRSAQVPGAWSWQAIRQARRLRPSARGQSRHHAAQPQPRGGVPDLHRAELAPGRARARRQRRAAQFPDLRGLRPRRLRPRRGGHGRPPGRRRQQSGLPRRAPLPTSASRWRSPC